MSECPLRTDTELLTRLTSHNPLIPLPIAQQRNAKIAHAPKRNHGLSVEGKQVSRRLDLQGLGLLFILSITLVNSSKGGRQKLSKERAKA